MNLIPMNLMNLIHATLEPNDNNKSGAAVTLYISMADPGWGRPPYLPSAQSLKPFFERDLGLELSVDTKDPFYSVGDFPNKLSEHAGLLRFQGYPTG